jgi:hypothetical protein
MVYRERNRKIETFSCPFAKSLSSYKENAMKSNGVMLKNPIDRN